MDEKNVTKISLSTLLIIIAIIVIIVMGVFIYKLNNDKTAEIQKSTEFQSQINSLNGTIDDLQGKINNISEIINSANNNTSQENVTTTTSLKLGAYTVDQVKLDEGGVSNEECGVRLLENNQFEIYMGWGAQHTGKYEIKDNNLICKSNLLTSESGGYFEFKTDVVFTFKIINNNKLELSKIDINDKEHERLVYPDGLTVGMTYSIK